MMPLLVCTPPLSWSVTTKSLYVAGWPKRCGSAMSRIGSLSCEPTCQSLAAGGELLDRLAEDVGERLVQGAGLVPVDEVGGVLRDAVGELVADDVERRRRTVSASPKAMYEPLQKALK